MKQFIYQYQYIKILQEMTFYNNTKHRLLSQLLIEQINFPNLNNYVSILSSSRVQIPRQQVIEMLLQLCKDNDKWLQPLNRLLEKNYLFVYQICMKDNQNKFITLRILANNVFNFGNEQIVTNIEKDLYNFGENVYNMKSQRQIAILVESFQIVIQQWMNNHRRRNILNVLNNSLTFMQYIHRNLALSIPIVQKFLFNVIKLFHLQQINSIKYLSYFQYLHGYANVIQFLQIYLKQLLVNFSSNLSNKLLEILIQYTGVITFSRMLNSNVHKFSQILSSISIQYSIENKQMSEIINLQYDMIDDQQSQIQPVLICKLITSLSQNIDTFFLQYFNCLSAKIKTQNSNIADSLLKLLLVKSICKKREFTKDLTNNLIEFIVKNNFDNFILEIRAIKFLDQFATEQTASICFNRYINAFQNNYLAELISQILSSALQNQVKQKRIRQNIIQIIKHFMNIEHNHSQNQKYYDLMHSYILKYQKIVERFGAKLIILLSKSLQTSIQKAFLSHLKINPVILRKINLISAILRQMYNNSVIDNTDQYFQIEESLLHIIEYIQEPQRLELDEQLIQIIQYLILMSDTITGGVCMNLIRLDQLFKKNNFNLSIFNSLLQTFYKPNIKKVILFQYEYLIRFFINLFDLYLEQNILRKQQFIEIYYRQFKETVSIIQKLIQNYEEFISDNEELYTKVKNKIQVVYFKLVKKLRQQKDNGQYSNFKDNCLEIQGNIEKPVSEYISVSLPPCIQCLLTLNHMSKDRFLYKLQLIQILNVINMAKIQDSYISKLIILNNCGILLTQQSLDEKLLENVFNYYQNSKKIIYNDQNVVNDLPFFKIGLKQLLCNMLRELKRKKWIDDMDFNQYMRKCR